MSNTAKVHVSYIIGILVATIILLVTARMATLGNVRDYITFALSLSSLLLALLAIVYAFIWNTSFTQTAGTLNAAAAGVTDSVAELKSHVGEITGHVKTLPLLLDKTAHDMTAAFESRVATLVPPAVTRPETPEDSAPDAEPHALSGAQVDAVAESFLQKSSPQGLLALYIAVRSAQTGVPFKIKAVSDSVEGIEGEYAWGYLVAASCTGVVGYTSEQVASVNPALTRGISGSIEAMCSRIVKKGKFPGIAAEMLRARGAIDGYFATESGKARTSAAPEAAGETVAE